MLILARGLISIVLQAFKTIRQLKLKMMNFMIYFPKYINITCISETDTGGMT